MYVQVHMLKKVIIRCQKNWDEYARNMFKGKDLRNNTVSGCELVRTAKFNAICSVEIKLCNFSNNLYKSNSSDNRNSPNNVKRKKFNRTHPASCQGKKFLNNKNYKKPTFQ